jgi:glutamate synthase domain-containing protein 2
VHGILLRHAGLVLALVLVVLGAWLWPSPAAGALALAGAALLLVGAHDLTQTQRSVLRNYPVLGHARYLMESIRPEMRQYFIEDDHDEVPFSRHQRAIVYQRAKDELQTRAFGTDRNVYGDAYEWINHSMVPSRIESADFRILIGADRAQPYAASVFNISAMSFGSLSANAILALNGGAKLGGFYHDTGEGSISRFHRQHGGDLVWEVGTGYFGCRADDGGFCSERFRENACDPQVKMIELKLSQGAKPGQGGLLPAAKVTPEIAMARGVPVGEDVYSPAWHSEFDTPIGLLQFIERLRELSGGKPTGFKLAIGHPWEWLAIARAMDETGIVPDFIVVDGAEGGTGAAPLEFSDHVGVPMKEGLMLVHNTLVGLELRSRVRIGAAGKIITAFDIARTLAIGADWCVSARGFMFALGCIQSRSCHTDHCPTGVATQDPTRQRSLVVESKIQRVHNYHRNTMEALRELLQAAGIGHPDQLAPEHIIRRVSQTEVRSLGRLYPRLQPGELIKGRKRVTRHDVFDRFWDLASAQTFGPPDGVRSGREAMNRTGVGMPQG